MTTLFFLMTSIFALYISSIFYFYGVLPSISESYYRLPANLKFLFTLFCWGFAIPAIILGNSLTMFFAGSGIVFVGAAAAFKKGTEHYVHMIAAGMGVLFSQLAIAFQYDLLWLNIIFICSTILLSTFREYIKNTHILWIELIAFISIWYVLKINII